MGHVVVKYKVTLDQPENGSPNYEGIASIISNFEEVQEVEIKPLAFGMMYIEVQAVLGEGEGIVVRAVRSIDGMSARYSEIPHSVLQKISTKITNSLKGHVNRVVYDITHKPPGTIEWE